MNKVLITFNPNTFFVERILKVIKKSKSYIKIYDNLYLIETKKSTEELNKKLNDCGCKSFLIITYDNFQGQLPRNIWDSIHKLE